ncbi:MAG: NADPH-dependent oxidoreductase [Pedobacter sp.]|nr:MAG: NADPH-dependent oxidoreductase [Pedobacter sp.]
MKIIAFAGSNSKTSINRKLAAYTAGLFQNANVEVLDLNDYVMPLFSVDLEKEIATPPQVFQMLEKFSSADLIILSLAENNGAYNAGFKNIFDWNSRTNAKQFQEKNMLLMATSPGGRGGTTVLEIAKNAFPRYGANIKATFSLPLFYDNFKDGAIVDPEKNAELIKIVESLS